jgi:hypothetical protein
MNITQLKTNTLKFIAERPDLKSELVDYYQLAVSEIEEGGSEDHECELAYSDMLDLINGENE